MGERSDKGIKLIRSERRTLSIELKPDGLILVRAPKRLPLRDIEAFLLEKEGWIRKKQEEIRLRESEKKKLQKFTEKELKELKKAAREKIPERVRFYSEKIGVSYGRVTIRAQKTRWGSCSREGNLSFNCLLMLAPLEVLDSVIVHELCHRKQMNHSAAFYREIYAVFPEYDRWHRWLRKNGSALMRRLPESHGVTE